MKSEMVKALTSNFAFAINSRNPLLYYMRNVNIAQKAMSVVHSNCMATGLWPSLYSPLLSSHCFL